MSTLTLLREADQDHEWYPTTREIIDAFLADLKREDPEEEIDWSEYAPDLSDQARQRIQRDHRRRCRARLDHSYTAILDIGAGNGKVLEAVHEAEIGFERYYAIEKSGILIQQLPSYVFTVGTEFHEQQLHSKPVDVLFCNPPYSQFAVWMKRIIREAAAREIYFVVPRRWEDNPDIANAIKCRFATVKILGDFDFEDAEDRRARAKVHLLRIDFDRANKDEAFERFFKEQFADLLDAFGETKEKSTSYHEQQEEAKAEAARRFESIVEGEDYASRLVRLYMEEMARIQKNCQLLAGLDAGMLREFEIHPSKILLVLKDKLQNLKHVYWQELFTRLSVVTDRLTSKSRNNLLGTLREHAHVDFTYSNIQAVLLWVIRHANDYLDSQLIATYNQMIETANVKLYKSNTRAFVYDRWRYNENKEPNSTHFYLEFRLVLNYIGGIKKTEYDFEKGLDENAADFLSDLLTIARNLGFDTSTTDYRLHRHLRRDWKTGDAQSFYFHDGDGVQQTLYKVRAFYNRNLHIQLHPDFALALNVEYGRLKGWLRSGGEAAKEMQQFKAASYFKSNHQILPASIPQLLLKAS